MRRWVIGSLLLSVAATSAAWSQASAPVVQPADAARLAAAHRLVERVLPPEQRRAMFASTIDALMKNMIAGMMQGDPRLGQAMEAVPALGPVFSRFVARQRQLVLDDLDEGMPALIDAYETIYARHFTTTELEELLRFLSTQTGNKFVAMSGTLLAEPELAAWQVRVAAKSRARQAEEIRRLMEEAAPLIEAQQKEEPRAS